jgi:hypothetical protein
MHKPIEDHVKLIYVKSPEYNPTSAFYIEGYIQVKSSDTAQGVRVHYSYDGSSWLISDASIFSASSDNTEIWYFRTPNTYNSGCCNFAIEYETGDNTFWDNNENNDYYLAWFSPTKILQGCSVVLDRVLRNSTCLFGNIVLKNISYEKQVKVIFSMDEWQTYEEAEAFFENEMSEELERWHFSIPVSSGNKINLAIQYVVGGATFLDNNFENDYICNPIME